MKYLLIFWVINSISGGVAMGEIITFNKATDCGVALSRIIARDNPVTLIQGFCLPVPRPH